MVEYQDDLAACVQARVVVVVQLGRGDSVTGECYWTGHGNVVWGIAVGIGEVEYFTLSVGLDREMRLLAVGVIFDERDFLEDGLQSGFGELGGDPLYGDLGAARGGEGGFQGA